MAAATQYIPYFLASIGILILYELILLAAFVYALRFSKSQQRHLEQVLVFRLLSNVIIGYLCWFIGKLSQKLEHTVRILSYVYLGIKCGEELGIAGWLIWELCRYSHTQWERQQRDIELQSTPHVRTTQFGSVGTAGKEVQIPPAAARNPRFSGNLGFVVAPLEIV